LPIDTKPEHDPDSVDLDINEVAINRKISDISKQFANEKKILGFDFPSYDVLRTRAERTATDLRKLEDRLSRYESAISRLRSAIRVLRHTELSQAKYIRVGKKELSEAMHHSLHDELTDLPNRRFFAEHFPLAHSLAKHTRAHGALLFIDLDKFKPVNDVHGHEVGDLLLIAVATRLLRCVREIDTVYRLGGDEFAVILSSLPSAQADAAQITQRVAQSIRTSLELVYRLNTSEMTRKTNRLSQPIIESAVSASIGGIVFNGRERNISQLLRDTDDAMYEVKRAGGNGVLIRNADPIPAVNPAF
jgi:diguanylate cyclase (GGDEF)-like protein